MADLVVVDSPDSLISLGLGSCIGVVIYDEVAKVAGMAHVMLPESRGADEKTEKPGKFANIAVPVLIEELLKRKAVKSRLKSKFAGGAQMFASTSGGGADFLSVGIRNAKEVEAMLAKCGIRVVASDTGGNKGRTVEFSTETWMLHIKVLSKGTTEI